MAVKLTYEELEKRVKELEQGAVKHKQVEETLRENEAKFRRISENIPAVVYQFKMNPDGEFSPLYINEKSIDIVGVSAEDILLDSFNFIEMVHPEDQKMFIESVLRSAETLESYHKIFRCLNNGEVLWVECRSTPSKMADGSILWDGLFFDITERKRVEEALRESEEKYRSLIENIPDITWTSDHEGNTTFSSQNTKKIYGYTPEEIYKDSSGIWFESIHPEDVGKVVEAFEALFEGDTCFDIEYRIKRKDGKWIWAHNRAISTYKKDGMLYTDGLFTDITERKQMEASLLESEEKWRSLTENSPDYIMLLDIDYNIQFINHIAPGFTLEEVIGVSCLDFVTPDQQQLAIDCFERVIQNCKPDHFGTQYTTTEGETQYFDVRVAPVTGKNGSVIGLTSSFNNITDRKDLEKQLQQSQKLEAIGTLAGGLAHDFNNILGSIILNSEMALKGIPENNDAKYLLEQVLSNSLRAKDLVKHILTFSRLEEVARKPLKISIVVKESLKMLRAMIPSTIVIRQNLLSDAATIMADPTQIQQLVTNLCTNSFHAMKKNGGTLDVELKNVKIDEGSSSTDLKAGSYVKLTVKDSGYGIAPEIKARIFDPFFTTKQPGEGTGLGLSVVHGIVISNEGAIKVDSDLDKGTAFHVFFPIINDTTVPFHESDKSLPTGNERILFVDDEETLVDSNQKMLERIGYTVVALNSSAEALELFQSNPDNFDLVITDTTMPNMTGLKLSEELMKICPDIPIIICSGHSDLITQEKLDTIGIREYVMKPFDMMEMAETIRRVLDNKSVERREHERFNAMDGAIAIPTSNLSKQGKIIDISKSGLAFCYKGNGELSKEFTELSISMDGEDLNLDNIPCQTISDFILADDVPLESMVMKRCSIQFGDLTSIQTDQLKHFIENHTIAG